MGNKKEEPKPGEIYRHFKESYMIYEVVAIARDCDNPEDKDVIYKSLYEGEFPVGTIWRRSLEEFVGDKIFTDRTKVKRFVKI